MENYSVIFITVLLTQTITKKKKLDSDMVHSVCVMNKNGDDGYTTCLISLVTGPRGIQIPQYYTPPPKQR